LLLVATANPEDYTNRGRIITPLKDRFGAEIRTHYPLDLDLELDLIRQEAQLVATVPKHVLEVVARFTRAVRESPSVDARSGGSGGGGPLGGAGRVGDGGGGEGPRLGAARGGSAGRGGAGRSHRRHRIGDQHAAWQGRVRERRGGPRDRDPRPPVAYRHRRDV